MLYQAIQAKSRELEDKLFDHCLNDPDEVIEFLDGLVEAVPYIEDTKNYGRSLSHYRKWSSILYSEFLIIYDKQINHFHAPPDDALDECILSQLNSFIDVTSIGDAESINNIINAFSEHFDPCNKYTFNASNLISDKEQAKLINTILINAEDAYRESNFDEVKRLNWNFVEYVFDKLKNNKQDTIDMFFLSWGLHSIGNIEYSCQRYKSAYQYYSYAFTIKDTLVNHGIDEDYIFLSKFSSEVKKIATSLAFSCNNEYVYLNNLIDAHERLNTRREQILATNSKWIMGIESYLYYLIGKAYLYINDRIAAEDYLNKSISIAKETGDEAAQARAVVFGYAYRAFKNDQFTDTLVELFHDIEVRKEWMNNPNIRRLRGGSIPYELRIQSVERAIIIENVFKATGFQALHEYNQNHQAGSHAC